STPGAIVAEGHPPGRGRVRVTQEHFPAFARESPSPRTPAMAKNQGMDSPHAWLTSTIGAYLLWTWGAAVTMTLVLCLLAGLWSRYRARHAGDLPPDAVRGGADAPRHEVANPF